MFRGNYTTIQSHFYMINDDHRTNNYIQAIQQKVKPNFTVIDLGAGTGILGLQCAVAGASTVHLVEQEETLVKVLEKTIENLNLSTKCKIHHKKSNVFLGNYYDKCNLIVCEGIGDHIFESRMIFDFLYYKDKLNIEHSIPEHFKLCMHEQTVRIDRDKLGVHQHLLDELEIPLLDSIDIVDNIITDPLYIYGDTIIKNNCILEFNCIADLEKPINLTLERLPTKDEYLILYFNIKLAEDVYLSNSPSRKDENHSYYQRLVSCKNIKSKNIRIEIDYKKDTKGLEDKPFPNIEILNE